MKQLMKIERALLGIVGISLAGLLFVGCQTTEDIPASAPNSHRHDGGGNVFQKGDPVALDYTGVSSIEFKPQTLTIKEDGTITLPYISTLETNVLAVGKTPGQLEREVQDVYNKYYKTLTVTVQPMQRYFYVYGEVEKNGPYPYLGETDIIKAITAAGGFTDFANRKKVHLTRSGAQKPLPPIDCVKIQRDPKYDVNVYPGDTINVPRRNPFSF